jgi:hypothetical protein
MRASGLVHAARLGGREGSTTSSCLREQVGVDGRGDRGRVGESAELSSDRIRDRTHGADLVP